jgi:hypothetical protein
MIAEKEAKERTSRESTREPISCTTVGGSKDFYIQGKEKNSHESKEMLSSAILLY